MLVARELVEQVLFGEFLPIAIFCSKLFRDRKHRHNRVGINAVGLDFIDNLLRVFQGFGMVGEDTSHLFGCLQPFLLGVVHSRRVVDVLACAEADETVVRLAVFLLHKVDVVGRDDLDIVFLRHLQDDFVHFLLALINLRIATWFVGLMTLYLKIIVIAKQILEPLNAFLRPCHVAIHDFLRHLARETGRAANHAFVVFFQQAVVDARIVIKAFGVGDGAQFAEAVVARLVLRQ